MTSYKLIIEKSTVPVKTGEWVKLTIRKNIKKNIPERSVIFLLVVFTPRTILLGERGALF